MDKGKIESNDLALLSSDPTTTSADYNKPTENPDNV